MLTTGASVFISMPRPSGGFMNASSQAVTAPGPALGAAARMQLRTIQPLPSRTMREGLLMLEL